MEDSSTWGRLSLMNFGKIQGVNFSFVFNYVYSFLVITMNFRQFRFRQFMHFMFVMFEHNNYCFSSHKVPAVRTKKNI